MNQNLLRKEFLRYVSLNVSGMIGLSCYIVADTFFISRGLGVAGLAALNLAIPVYSVLHGCGLMLGLGGAARYSIRKSQQDHEQADHTFTVTVGMALALAVIFVLLGATASAPITRLLGADATVFSMTKTYVTVLLLFSPAFLLNDVLLCFVRNDGDPRRSMLAMVGGSLSNILLDYVLIFPLGLGMFGAVFATGLAPIISLRILSPHWRRADRGFHLIRWTRPWKTMGRIFSLGFPSLVTELASGIVILVLNGILLDLAGNVGVAAYGVIANISLVVVAVYTGIGQGSQPLFSRAYGAGQQDTTTKLLQYALLAVTGISLVLYGVIYCFADSIAQLFNHEQNVQLKEIATTGLRIYFTAGLFCGSNILLSMFFSATERAWPGQIISMLRGFVLIIPLAYLFSQKWGLIGVWLAFPVTELAVSLLGCSLIRPGRKIRWKK